MKGVIKSNEAIGKEIENLVNKRVKGIQNSKMRGIYDIETEKELIEVKGARRQTITDSKKRMRPGRFGIYLSAHQKLLEAAKAKLKVPLYIFCVYELRDNKPVIVKIKTELWVVVDGIMAFRPQFKRKDGMKFVMLPHPLIFGADAT